MAKQEEMHDFKIALLGIIFNPKTKKILIGKRDKNNLKITWCFPGGRLNLNEDVEEALKKRISETTNLKVENLGCIFSRVPPEQQNLLLSYYLCEVTGGKEKAGTKYQELKWVNPEDLEKHFTTSFHPHMKEYIMNLK